MFIAGGGALTEAIRDADRDFKLGDRRSHWLCIDAMSITSEILAAVLPDCRHISGLAELSEHFAKPQTHRVVFDARDFLRRHEPQTPGPCLPHDWSVTSDSISARLAQVLPADELVLLKSTDPPANTLSELAACDFVDRFFSVAAAEMSPRFVNLRSCAV